jgi:hypothetical protein
MFPERIGRVVLDGVADAPMWSGGSSILHCCSYLRHEPTGTPVHKWFRRMLTSAEAAYDQFLAACSQAGPERCALAHSNDEDPKAIDARIEGLFSTLYERPMSGVSNHRAGVLTSGRARSARFIPSIV